MTSGDPRITIVGAGPCGIAAARELARSGVVARIAERADRAGGLASSSVDDAGFTWDRGGHVVFSHHDEFDALLADALGEEMRDLARTARVHVGRRWVRYPFQQHLGDLADDDAFECLVGLIDAQHRAREPQRPRSLSAWMDDEFGAGIVERFMRPYNEKVWATPLDQISTSWMGERVATADWRDLLRRVVCDPRDADWGPNSTFRFPHEGGTGRIFERAAARLPIEFGVEVAAIDVAARQVHLSDGRHWHYDHLVWTGPVDRLVTVADHVPPSVRAAADRLVHNSVTVVGLGYESALTDVGSWFYFPSPDVPFHRATNFAAYSPANVPDSRTDRYCSWLTETSRPGGAPPPGPELVTCVDGALRSAGLVPDDARVCSVHVDDLAYAYPVPTIDRDDALDVIQPWLEQHRIYARGRFGTWRYEIGNMDHAVKMGVDVARRILFDRPEELVGVLR